MKALIVEDEVLVAYDLSTMLEQVGYVVPAVATSVGEALEAVEQHSPDVVLIDIMLGGERDGIDLGRILQADYDLPFLYVTSHADRSTVERAKATRPSGYLVKPFTESEVYAATEIALSHFAERSDDATGADADQSSGGLPAFRLRKVLAYIEEHVTEDLKLDTLAEVAGMSKYHFSRLFKDAVGVPPYRYVVQQRVEAARSLLLGTDLSVTEIALRTGFSSQSHLSTAFREHTGTTPVALREKR